MKIFENGIEIGECDLIALNNELVSVEAWVMQMLEGKIASCKKNLLTDWLPKLVNEPDEQALIMAISERQDYQPRVVDNSEPELV